MFSNLIDELVLSVFKFVEGKDLLQLQRCSRRFYLLIKSNYRRLPKNGLSHRSLRIEFAGSCIEFISEAYAAPARLFLFCAPILRFYDKRQFLLTEEISRKVDSWEQCTGVGEFLEDSTTLSEEPVIVQGRKIQVRALQYRETASKCFAFSNWWIPAISALERWENFYIEATSPRLGAIQALIRMISERIKIRECIVAVESDEELLAIAPELQGIGRLRLTDPPGGSISDDTLFSYRKNTKNGDEEDRRAPFSQESLISALNFMSIEELSIEVTIQPEPEFFHHPQVLALKSLENWFLHLPPLTQESGRKFADIKIGKKCARFSVRGLWLTKEQLMELILEWATEERKIECMDFMLFVDEKMKIHGAQVWIMNQVQKIGVKIESHREDYEMLLTRRDGKRIVAQVWESVVDPNRAPIYLKRLRGDES